MQTIRNNNQPITAEWRAWVVQNLAKGVPAQTVHNILVSNSFNKNEIEEVIKKSQLSLQQPSKQLDPNWQEWIAKNLIEGVSQDKISAVLREQGCSEIEILNEINRATESPYIKAAADAMLELNKRNWLLETCDDLARLDPSYNRSIDVIDAPPFEVFINNYYSKNKPVVLKKGIDSWAALKKWTPSYFAENFGDEYVQVQYGRDDDPKFELNSVKLRKEMKLSEFVDLIETQGESNNYYMTANNSRTNLEAIRPAFDDLGDFAEGYRDMSKQPEYSTFFWMGPKGIFTPMHHDLTNNMLVQVYGSKKVTLIPAFQAPFVYNKTHVFSETDFPNIDLERFPLMRNATPVEVTLHAGDSLFIPIGWWHCVHGLEISISISFVNFNAPNHYADSYPKS